MALPLADPEFWLVTAGAALALGYALRRMVRSARAESEMPCDKCPKPGLAPPPRRGGSGPRSAALLALALLAAPASDAATIERRVASMGTTLTATLDDAGDRAAALATAEAALRTVADSEARLSTWRDDSELARLNGAPVGDWFALSPALATALRGAIACADESAGAFDPGLGALVAAWGLRGGGRLPAPDELESARRRSGARVAWSADGASLRKLRPFAFEEGAFGKGAALDLALDSARGAAAGSPDAGLQLDLGGQLAWVAPAGTGRRVEIADPRDRSRPVLALRIERERGSIATSGDSERRFTAGGRTFGHLLDPRTGAPAPDFGSVSVLAARALRADCLSTALFVMGPAAGARWLASESRDVEVVYLIAAGRGLRAELTPGLAAGARALVADLTIEVMRVSS